MSLFEKAEIFENSNDDGLWERFWSFCQLWISSTFSSPESWSFHLQISLEKIASFSHEIFQSVRNACLILHLTVAFCGSEKEKKKRQYFLLSLVSTICLDQESGFVAKVGTIREMCPSLLLPRFSMTTVLQHTGLFLYQIRPLHWAFEASIPHIITLK